MAPGGAGGSHLPSALPSPPDARRALPFPRPARRPAPPPAGRPPGCPPRAARPSRRSPLSCPPRPLARPCAFTCVAGRGEERGEIPGSGRTTAPSYYLHLALPCPSRLSLRDDGTRAGTVCRERSASPGVRFLQARPSPRKAPLRLNPGKDRTWRCCGGGGMWIGSLNKMPPKREGGGMVGEIRKRSRKCSQATILCKSYGGRFKEEQPTLAHFQLRLLSLLLHLRFCPKVKGGHWKDMEKTQTRTKDARKLNRRKPGFQSWERI